MIRRLFKDRKCTNQLVLEMLKSGEDQRAYSCLYELGYDAVEKALRKWKVQDQDIMDVFQDAITVFLENYRAGKYKPEAPIKAYLTIVAKNIWLNRKRGKKKNFISLEEFIDYESEQEQILPEIEYSEELVQAIWNCYNQLKDKDQELIELHYYEHKTFEKIAEELGYSSPQTARQTAYRIRKKWENCVDKKLEN